ADAREVLRAHRPKIVFNAAAYKHVPIVERNPREGVQVNALAASRLMALAEAEGVARFVQISTDKAVNPTNVMGAAKRVAELAARALAAEGARMRMITTRFGNVLGSAGSVVPLFEEQIRRGGPVTVTHPEMRRYFMTIEEAVRLILQAAARGEGGEIFVLDMGEPVRIVDLARQMIRLAGLEPERDVPIVFTGLRPGEKLYEELFYANETPNPAPVPGLLLAAAPPVDRHAFRERMKALEKAVDSGDPEAIRRALQGLVPEYRPMQDATHADESAQTLRVISARRP
ncbi:MAG: polysaccharide biosynthesis protein, partial [Zetaproteobacteria bacterium]